nr:MASE1 domain-containing protein [Sulfurimonas sp. hsl 1-7]
MLSLVESESVFAIWPPTGIALSALIIFGYRIWPGIFIGALILNLTLTPLLPSIQIAITNTIGPLIGFWILNKFTDKKIFTSLRSMLLFFVAIVVASLVTSLSGSFTLLLHQFITTQAFMNVWSSWFLGDLIGFLLITSLVISIFSEEEPFKHLFSIEGISLLLLLVTSSLIFFGPLELFDTVQYPVVYFLLLPLIWGVFRFTTVISVSMLLYISLVAIYGTILEYGPFLRTEPNQSLLLLQSFIGFLSVIILLMITIFREREESLNNAINLAATQNELLQRNRWYKELFDISPVGIALNKMSGEFIDVNSTLHEMCGYTKEEFTKLSYWDLTPIEYEEQEALQLESLRVEGKYGPYEKEYIHKDGHRFPVLLNGVKNVNNDGDEYIWSVVQNITELSKAHHDLKVNELKFRRIFEQANDGILIIENGVFTSCNEKALQMLRCEKDYIIGKSPDQISPLQQKDGTLSLEKVLSQNEDALNGISRLFEWQHLDPSGNIVDIEVSLGLIGDKDSTTLLCLWRDISERKQYEENLHRAKEKAEKANISKSQFLANMTHELRTPLNSINILSELLMHNSNNNLTSKQLEQLNVIHHAGNDLLLLINDILDLSKIEANKTSLHLNNLIFQDLVNSLNQLFQPVAQEKNIAMGIQISNDIDTIIYTDTHKVMQIIRNFISNALKFTHTNGEVNVTISSSDKPEYSVAISVEDTGIGIPEDKIESVFNSFEQVDGTTSRKYGGTGLGLAISNKLAHILQGKIILKSIINKGSKFTLYLPKTIDRKDIDNGLIECIDKESIRYKEGAVQNNIPEDTMEQHINSSIIEDNKQTNAQNITKFISGKRILIVDDDIRNVFALSSLIEGYCDSDVDIMTAFNGQEALEIIKSEELDLVFMDIMMPEMDGYETIEHINSLELKKFAIVILSAKPQERDQEKFAESGADFYLNKPIDSTDFENIIVELFGKN